MPAFAGMTFLNGNQISSVGLKPNAEKDRSDGALKCVDRLPGQKPALVQMGIALYYTEIAPG
tara:strand:+ start:66819 stop:67004 length:186 start_codon:yes stop_codon:yes gene_type:complete